MNAMRTLTGGKGADRRDRPEPVFKKISPGLLDAGFAPWERLLFVSCASISNPFFPFCLSRQTLARPLGIGRSLEKTGVRTRLVKLVVARVKSAEIANHPLAIVLFPIKRGLPLFSVPLSPSGGMPPAKIFVTAVIY